jgi:hypothetical protein
VGITKCLHALQSLIQKDLKRLSVEG